MVDGFDALIHAPPRLQICAILAQVDTADFATIRDLVEVSDSVLSKHLGHLAEAGVVAIRKQMSESRARTWASLTPEGRSRFNAHVQALRATIEPPTS